MASIKNKNIAKILLENRGKYENDVPVRVIYSYELYGSGEKHYALFYRVEDDDLNSGDTEYCKNVKLLMSGECLTADGMAELEELKQQ